MLLENAELIADAVAVAGEAEGGHTVQETGGQAAQATVTQPGILFYFFQFFKVQAHLWRRREGGRREGEEGKRLNTTNIKDRN
jgi:hypothetical protein